MSKCHKTKNYAWEKQGLSMQRKIFPSQFGNALMYEGKGYVNLGIGDLKKGSFS